MRDSYAGHSAWKSARRGPHATVKSIIDDDDSDNRPPKLFSMGLLGTSLIAIGRKRTSSGVLLVRVC